MGELEEIRKSLDGIWYLQRISCLQCHMTYFGIELQLLRGQAVVGLDIRFPEYAIYAGKLLQCLLILFGLVKYWH